MSEKKLSFQFVLDDQSFARVRRALGQLTTEAQKFAKAMNSTGGGGGLMGGTNVGGRRSAAQTQSQNAVSQKTSIGSAILGDVEAFQKLARSGKEGMSAMTDAVRKGVREQMAEIERLEKKMAVLQARFNKDPRAAYEGAFRNNLQAQMISRQGQINGAQGSLGQLQGLQGGLQPGGGGAGIGGLMGIGGAGIGGAGIGGLMGIGGAVAAGIAAGIKVVNMGTGVAMALNNTQSVNSSERGQATSSLLGRARRADVSDQLKFRYIASMQPEEQQKLWAQVGSPDEKTADFLKNPFSTTKSTDTRTLERVKGVLDKVGQDERFNAEIGRAYDFANDTRGERIGSSRIRGSGYYKQKDGTISDSFTQSTSRLMRRGYSNAELDAATIQARHLGGGAFTKEAGAIMGANAMGFGNYGQYLASANAAGGTRNLALGGKISTAAGLNLGTALTGFNASGTTSGNALLGAMQGPGFTWGKGPGDMNQVQSVLAGIGAGNQITTGGLDEYQAGINTLNAINSLPGGSTYAQDYLANGMDLRQLSDAARGNLTGTAKALGITQESAQAQLSGSFSSVLDRYQSQGTGDTLDKAMLGYQKARESGMGADEYLKKLYSSGQGGSADALGAYYGLTTGSGDAGISLGKTIAGLGTEGIAGRDIAGGLDTETMDKLDAQAKQFEKSATAFKENMDLINEAYGNNEAFEKLTTGFGKMEISVDKLTKAFEYLADISPAVKAKIEDQGFVGTLRGIARTAGGGLPNTPNKPMP